MIAALSPHLAKDPNSDRPPLTREEIHARTLWKINKYRFAQKHFNDAMPVEEYAIRLFACEMGDNPTPIESAVMDALIHIGGCTYRGSQVVSGGRYIVDFVCQGNIVIECDGAKYHQERDRERDQFLIDLGFRVLHLSGSTCMNWNRCVNQIERFIEDKEANLRYCR